MPEQRQGDTSAWYKICNHRHIQKNLYSQKRAYTAYHKKAEFIPTVQPYPEATQNKHCKKAQNERSTNKAKFLTNNRENKIVMRFGYPKVFLP